MLNKKENENKNKQLEKAEFYDLLERINGNIEEVWHKLDLVAHYLDELSESREFEDAIIYLARAHSKEYDMKCKAVEDAVAGKV